MRDMDETKVREELFDLVRDVDVAPGLERRTIRRARRRRALTASATAFVAVALVAASYTGLRAALGERPSQFGDRSPSPTVSLEVEEPEFRGIWPSTSQGQLTSIQQAVNEGHQPWQLDARMTAEAFAVNVLDWAPEAVENSVETESSGEAVVVVWNGEREARAETRVFLEKLGDAGPNGIWTVVRAENDLVQVDELTVTNEGVLGLLFSLSADADGELSVELGAYDETVEGSPVVGGTFGPLGEGTLPGEIEGSVLSVDGSLTVVLSVLDTDRTKIAVEAFSIAFPITGIPSPSVDFTSLPPDVAATAQRIYDGVLNRDFELLASLIDPMTFAHNADDGSNPIPGWRDNPRVLDAIPAILSLPPSAPREIEGYGTFYLWPYLVDSDFSNLTDQEREDLASLGFSERDIEIMVEQNFYLGPRLAIDADGVWRNYITGGD
jgi:hypothetical protein